MFFFFKQKTAYEMRISDWSSDVCSSDLTRGDGEANDLAPPPHRWQYRRRRRPGRRRLDHHGGDRLGRRIGGAAEKEPDGTDHDRGRRAARDRQPAGPDTRFPPEHLIPTSAAHPSPT